MDIRHMLVVIDPISDLEQPCLRRAEQLAAHYPEARITLFLCDYNAALSSGMLFNSTGLEEARQSLIKHRQAYLDQLAEPLRAKGLNVATHATWGKRLERHILQAVQELGADLLLKTTHHHNPFKRLLLSNTDWQLIRHSEVPLWLVKKAELPLNKLCASVDPLHQADKPAALDLKLISQTQALASALNAEVHIAHCYSPLPRTLAFDASIIADYDGYAQDVRQRHAEAFAELTGNSGVSTAEQHLLEGYPETAIPEFIEQRGIDLLVMGAVSRSRLDSALLGHTAERLLDDVPCDVLIIKPDGFVDPSKPAS